MFGRKYIQTLRKGGVTDPPIQKPVLREGKRYDRFISGNDPVPILQRAGCFRTGVIAAEDLATTGIRSPDSPGRSESLYVIGSL